MVARDNSKKNGDVTIYVAKGMLQAMMIQETLENIGIPVSLKQKISDHLFSSKLGCCGDVELMVPQNRIDDVIDLIEVEALNHGVPSYA